MSKQDLPTFSDFLWSVVGWVNIILWASLFVVFMKGCIL